MRKINPLPFGLFLLLGCAPVGRTNPIDSASHAILDQPTKNQKACYSGVNQSECFETVELATLPEQKDLYIYGDPAKDSTFPKNFNQAQYLAPHRILDLRTIQSSIWLSPHFQKFEVLPFDQNRGYFGLFSPSALVKIESLRNSIGRAMKITSGYRSPGRNSEVSGAAKWSRHTYGDAIDFKVSGLSYKKTAEFCVKAGASFYQLYSDHIHCDWRDLSLPEAFYPVAAGVAATGLWAEKLSANVKIEKQLDQSSANDGFISFHVKFPQEDDGELTYDWSILLPDGTFENSQLPVARVRSLPGEYRIKVRVGDSVIAQQTYFQQR